MYSSEITNQFIELRSRDISLERIAQQLGINKSTAIDWQRRYQVQIDEFKAIHLDAVRERLTTRYEDELEFAMGELKRIRAELKTRDWDFEATTFLHHAEASAYRRVQKLSALADFPKAGKAAAPSASEISRVNPQPETAPSTPLTAQPHVAPKSDEGGPTFNGSSSARVETQNPSKTQPFPNQKDGGSASTSLNPNRNLNLAVSAKDSAAPLNPPSAPLRLCVEPPADNLALEAEPFVESTVVSPNECLRSVLEKCLLAETTIPNA